MSKEAYGDQMAGWDRLAQTVENNAEELRYLQEQGAVLKEALAEAREAKHRQTLLRAAAQQASRDLESAMEKANDAAVRLNRGLLSVYGYKSEKLVEFGLRPWRPRRRKAALEASESAESATQPIPSPPKPRRKRRS